jgi:protein-L-isoaspartate(D-aspartate) O-methyltransferase
MTTASMESAREQMVYHQVRPWDVLDERVLSTLNKVPRERFVPDKYAQIAFADTEIPLPCNQRMLKPIVEGRFLQALELQPTNNVLVVGTGSGFTTACIATLADHVTSIDIHVELTEAAAAVLTDEKIRNVDLQTADFTEFTPGTSFDRILVTGSIPTFDPRLPEWLNDGGRLIVVTGEQPAMQVECVVRADNHYSREILFETVIQRLENVASPARFAL